MLEREEEQQSGCAPGPVLGDEDLARLVFWPDHCDRNSRLRPEGIPRQDLNERGFSVYRKDVANGSASQLALIEDVIAGYLAKNPSREFRGVADVVCEVVRSIVDDEGEQAFIVIDDAQASNDVAHTAIMFARAYGEGMQRKLRERLRRKFGSVVAKAEIFALT